MDPVIIVPIVITLGLIVMSVVIVPEKSAKVIQRLGKFNRVAFSGLSFKIPIIGFGNRNCKPKSTATGCTRRNKDKRQRICKHASISSIQSN